jgi:hypothetical protein
MSPLPQFFEKELEDQYARENFRKLREFLTKETPFLGFKFFEVEFKAAAADFDFQHGLGFQPQDAMITFVSNGAVVTFSYDSFTKEAVRMTVSKECKVRMILGSFQ